MYTFRKEPTHSEIKSILLIHRDYFYLLTLFKPFYKAVQL